MRFAVYPLIPIKLTTMCVALALAAACSAPPTQSREGRGTSVPPSDSSSSEGKGTSEPAEDIARAVRDLESDLESVRHEAVRALGKVAPRSQEAVSALARTALEDDDEYVRSNAVRALRGVRSNPEEVVSTLAKVLSEDGSTFVRMDAAMALGRFGDQATGAVPELIAALRDGHQEVRLEAAHTLGNIGPGAGQAVPALILACESDLWLPGREAGQALERICTADHIDAIAALLKAERGFIRWRAGRILEGIGGPAVPALVRALDGGPVESRWQAADTLGRIGPAAKQAVPALQAMSQAATEASLRRVATEALDRITAQPDNGECPAADRPTNEGDIQEGNSGEIQGQT